MSEHKFLIHETGDDVGVAVQPISKGEKVVGVDLKTKERIQITSNNDIPMGHKIALVGKEKGSSLTKYGEDVGEITESFSIGDWVHTHNLRTKRWNYGN